MKSDLTSCFSLGIGNPIFSLFLVIYDNGEFVGNRGFFFFFLGGGEGPEGANRKKKNRRKNLKNCVKSGKI